MKKSRADRVFDAVNVALMIAVLFLMLYPIYFTVIASFSEPSYVATGKVTFWVRGYSLSAIERYSVYRSFEVDCYNII